jgi:hypothetical protein
MITHYADTVNLIYASVFVLSLAVGTPAIAQGTFWENLDFELADVPPTPVGAYGDTVDPALAFPSWTLSTVSLGTRTNYGFYILYNNMTLDSPAIDLVGPEFPNGPRMTPLQGSYSVFMQYSIFFQVAPRLSQTAVVPSGARSINFLGHVGQFAGYGSVSLNGQELSLFQMGDRLWADVTPFAGQMATLAFTGDAYVDDIQFSPQSIPEPGVVGLLGLGALLFVWRHDASRRLRADGAFEVFYSSR